METGGKDRIDSVARGQGRDQETVGSVHVDWRNDKIKESVFDRFICSRFVGECRNGTTCGARGTPGAQTCRCLVARTLAGARHPIPKAPDAGEDRPAASPCPPSSSLPPVSETSLSPTAPRRCASPHRSVRARLHDSACRACGRDRC